MANKPTIENPKLPLLSLDAFTRRERQYREFFGKVDYRDLLRQLGMSHDLSDLPKSLLSELLVPTSREYELNPANLDKLYSVFYAYLKQPHDPQSIEVFAYFLTPFLPAISRFLHEHSAEINKNPDPKMEDYRAILQALSLAVDAGLAYAKLRVNDIHRAMLKCCVDERWVINPES